MEIGGRAGTQKGDGEDGTRGEERRGGARGEGEGGRGGECTHVMHSRSRMTIEEGGVEGGGGGGVDEGEGNGPL